MDSVILLSMQKYISFNEILMIITLVVIVACATVPGTGKKIFVITSPQQENALGLQAFNEIKQKEKVSTNPRWNQIIQRVGRRIAAQAPVNFDWEFKIIESDQKNAFCLPGGKVAFYTGIFPVLQNEAAMAMVMGHEVAHAVARHAGQRMSQAQVTGIGMALTSALAFKNNKNRGLILGALGIGAQVGIALPFSRSHETEADKMGLVYAAKAGYDPREAAKLWARMGAASGGKSPPEFLSTHPASSRRVQNLRVLAEKNWALYQTSPRYGLGVNL